MNGGWTKAALAAGIAAVVLGMCAVPAEAGTYVVRQCDGVGAGSQPLAPDAIEDAPSIAYALRNTCAPGTGSLRVDNVQRTPLERYGAWAYDAPGGTQLKAL